MNPSQEKNMSDNWRIEIAGGPVGESSRLLLNFSAEVPASGPLDAVRRALRQLLELLEVSPADFLEIDRAASFREYLPGPSLKRRSNSVKGELERIAEIGDRDAFRQVGSTLVQGAERLFAELATTDMLPMLTATLREAAEMLKPERVLETNPEKVIMTGWAVHDAVAYDDDKSDTIKHFYVLGTALLDVGIVVASRREPDLWAVERLADGQASLTELQSRMNNRTIT